ncbi:MAG TPA: FAD/NAD(P)-binding oxidoreductase [Acidobacteriaceae bacterium]
MTQNFDIAVVGAGPAGMAAAVTASEAGKRVALLDDNPAPGGQIWRRGARLPEMAEQWQARLDRSAVVRLQGWRVFDCPGPTLIRAERNGAPGAAEAKRSPDRDSYAELRCEKLILATGARERFLPFPGWTLPNVMGAGGMDAMVRGGLAVAEKRVVVAGTGPLLFAVAAHLAEKGARIVAVCEQASLAQLARFGLRMATEPAKLWQGLHYRRTFRQARFLTDCWVVAAHGSDRLNAVTLRQGDKRWDVACDYLACGFHLVPNTELPERLGCRIADGFVATDETLQTSVFGVYCVGEPTGIGGVELSLVEGQIAALAAVGSAEAAQKLGRRRRGKLGFVRALYEACTLNPLLRALAVDNTIVCRCEDVRFGALREAGNWRQAKLHTRCGMGPCQGRICGAATEFIFGWQADSVRPPVFPALVSSLAASGEAGGKARSRAVVSAFPEP